MNLALQDGFWIVHIPFGSNIQFQYVAQFPLSRAQSFTPLALICYIHLYKKKKKKEKKARNTYRSKQIAEYRRHCGKEARVREFVLQSRYYIHFRANTPGKGMNPLILPAIG